jgi:calcium/calmodulin-dependent protein kinase I
MRGLKFLHMNDIVHRNLKPSNIFWHLNHIKIGDLGMAASFGSMAASIQKSTSIHNYMPPEMLDSDEKQNRTAKIDVWSAGCILYELITLKKAFKG